MDLKQDKGNLLQYYQTVRQAISGFDTLVTNSLTRGATATFAILAATLAIIKTEEKTGRFDWQSVFLLSLFAVAAALYVLTAVTLYADLLKRAVTLGKKLENEIFDAPNDELLTTHLDEHPLAGGKFGTILYLFMAIILYVGAASFSTFFFCKWQGTPWPAGVTLFIVFLVWLALFWCRGAFRTQAAVTPRQIQ